MVRTGTREGIQYIAVSLAENGTPIQMDGDGGTGTADNALPAHINIALADWFGVCGVRSFSLDISRDELDITSLPCHTNDASADDGCTRLASFRSTQSGYASATGSMEVYFTCDREHRQPPAEQLLLRNQSMKVKLVAPSLAATAMWMTLPLFVEVEIITGMSFGQPG